MDIHGQWFTIFIYDLSHPQKSSFYTRALIWMHFKTVHYFSQQNLSLILYLKNSLHNLVIELCSALNVKKILYSYLSKSRAVL